MGTLDSAVLLSTPPLACVVPPYVFDAYQWCPSSTLVWRPSPNQPLDPDEVIEFQNPAEMAFVMTAPCSFLPRELAHMHLPWWKNEEDWALAPYGIDDATDGLYALRVNPSTIFCLAGSTLNALVWGLHDWAHFHHHGAFEERAWTELQCDISALAWVWANLRALNVTEANWDRVRLRLMEFSGRRFREEQKDFDATLFNSERIIRLIA